MINALLAQEAKKLKTAFEPPHLKHGEEIL
jgi:hypothetical protein